jgi:hypothetical protein
VTSNLEELAGMWEDHAERLTRAIQKRGSPGSPIALGARDTYEECAAQLRAAVEAND